MADHQGVCIFETEPSFSTSMQSLLIALLILERVGGGGEWKVERDKYTEDIKKKKNLENYKLRKCNEKYYVSFPFPVHVYNSAFLERIHEL